MNQASVLRSRKTRYVAPSVTVTSHSSRSHAFVVTVHQPPDVQPWPRAPLDVTAVRKRGPRSQHWMIGSRRDPIRGDTHGHVLVDANACRDGNPETAKRNRRVRSLLHAHPQATETRPRGERTPSSQKPLAATYQRLPVIHERPSPISASSRAMSVEI